MKISDWAENKNTKILIVTEDEKKFKRLKHLFEAEEFVVSAILDGKKILPTIKSYRPDLVMLETSIAGKDGFDICRHLKADAELTNIPVLFLSAKNSNDEKIQGLKSGGADLLTEPLNDIEVMLRVKSQLGVYSLQKSWNSPIKRCETNDNCCTQPFTPSAMVSFAPISGAQYQ